jgi:sec-independent protein translocase protein TatA
MGKIEGLLVVLAIVMLFFGAKKLPELARSVGESARELKKGFNLTGESSEVKSITEAAKDKS